MPTSNEKSFFEDILSFESKGWRVAIPQGIEPGSIQMGQLSVHVYVVDVPGGQFWRGAITPDEFLRTLEQCKAQNSTNAARVIATVERMRRYESFAKGAVVRYGAKSPRSNLTKVDLCVQGFDRQDRL